MPQVRESTISNGSDATTSQLVESFRSAVIDRFRMNLDGQECTYQEYLIKPEGKRSGDEANAVDIRFTRYVLEWLGFSDSEWSYNEPQAGQKANRPDYVIRGAIGVAFIWEDKNSTLELSEAHIAQMRRYSLGTAGYAVWSNMRRIYAVHFSPSDALKYEIISDVAIDILFGPQTSLPEAKNTQMTNLALFHLLFGKARFTQFEQLIKNIGVSEELFTQNAASFDEPRTVQSFIAGSRLSLNHLRLAALAQIKESLEHHERSMQEETSLKRMRFEASNPTRITDVYGIWSERQSDKEDLKPEIFAEQVAYVFFVRLLLVRVLEDKHILSPRLASDGGFLDWSNYVKRHFKELDGIGILNENYYNILSRKAGHYYLHFFQQNIFDWFNPDDFLLVETLEFLCRYNFQQVISDIIGFTYEEYIERNARNRKGHFLTRQDVVEYMLDLLDYTGPQVIGRRILDPACGSGSFLVHAARRYRQALLTYFSNTHGLATAEAIEQNAELRKQLAHRYLEDLSHLFYGTELNPFACYLAEMNLLIQGLDDLVVLQQSDDTQPIERFQIYNTDSLDLPREVLDSSDITGTRNTIFVPDRLSDRLTDDAYPLKAKLDTYAEGFFYIISNPPYVNSRQELMDVSRFKKKCRVLSFRSFWRHQSLPTLSPFRSLLSSGLWANDLYCAIDDLWR